MQEEAEYIQTPVQENCIEEELTLESLDHSDCSLDNLNCHT